MIEWLKRLFRNRDRFHIPARKQPLPKCRIRPFTDADVSACIDIYCLNEPGRFPPGYLGHFSEWLQSRRELVLICEAGGAVRGLGGICQQRRGQVGIACLDFGMIHPAYHKQGYGTALLLARLATLPLPDFQWAIVISTTGGSESFYQRFGFTYFNRFFDEDETPFDQYYTHLYKEDWQTCRSELSKASIILDTADAVVPITGDTP